MQELLKTTWLRGIKTKEVEDSKYPFIHLKVPSLKGPQDQLERLIFDFSSTCLWGISNYFNGEFKLGNTMYQGLDQSIKEYGDTVSFMDKSTINSYKFDRVIGSRSFYYMFGCEIIDEITVKTNKPTGYGLYLDDILLEYPKEYYYYQHNYHNLFFRTVIKGDNMVKFEKLE